MISPGLRLAVLAASSGALLSLPAGWWVLTRPLLPASQAASLPHQVPTATAAPNPAAVDSVTSVATARAPFRASRRVPTLRFDARVSPVALAASPSPPRPVLSVTGILWGPVPSAIVDGIPGVEGGRVVRAGDTINGVSVRSITRERVIARGYDTTWNLTVRETWR